MLRLMHDPRNAPESVRSAKNMKSALRLTSRLALSVYLYGELAAHVYPFVLLPHVGVTLRVIALTFFAFIHAGTTFGWATGSLMFLTTGFVTWSFEQVGVATGAIYGHYHYSDMLGPKLGAIPILIPLAWFMMIYPSYLGSRIQQNLSLKRWHALRLLSHNIYLIWDR
jgi:uncharacterized membrane protein